MLPTVTVADILAAQKAQSPEALDKKAQEDKFAQRTEQLSSIEKSIYQAFSGLVQYMDGKVSKTEVVNQLTSIATPDSLKVIPAIESMHETLKEHENVDLSEVTTVIRELLDEAKKIPKELPSIPETKVIDYSDKFKNLEDLLQGVEEAIKAQKLIAEAPVVHVPEAKVEVQAPDLSGIEKGQKEIVDAVKDIVIPEYKQDNSGVETLLKKLDKRLKSLPDEMPRPSGGGGSIASFRNATGNVDQVVIDSTGNLPVSTTKRPMAQKITVSGTDTYVAEAVPGTLQASALWQAKKISVSGSDTVITWADGNANYDNVATTLTGLTYS